LGFELEALKTKSAALPAALEPDAHRRTGRLSQTILRGLARRGDPIRRERSAAIEAMA
jgi:hypothetical protein